MPIDNPTNYFRILFIYYLFYQINNIVIMAKEIHESDPAGTVYV